MARDIGDVYGEPVVYVYKNFVIRNYHPILTPEERERRMMDIARAAADLIASAEEGRGKECSISKEKTESLS